MVLNDIVDLREEKQRLLDEHECEREIPFIRQVQGHGPMSQDVSIGTSMPNGGRGKKKVTSVKINEPANTMKVQNTMSTSDIELEEEKKKKDDVENGIERVETKATITETKKKILFLKILSSTQGMGASEVSSLSNLISSSTTSCKNVTLNIPSSSFARGDANVKEDAQARIHNSSFSRGASYGGPQRRPIELEGYKQLFFDGIPRYPNPISQ